MLLSVYWGHIKEVTTNKNMYTTPILSFIIVQGSGYKNSDVELKESRIQYIPDKKDDVIDAASLQPSVHQVIWWQGEETPSKFNFMTRREGERDLT